MIYDTKLMIGNRFRAPIFGSKRLMRVVGWCLLEKNNHCVGAAFTFQLLVFCICLRANSPSSCVAFMRYTLRRPSVRPRVLDLTVIFHIFIYYLFIRFFSVKYFDIYIIKRGKIKPDIYLPYNADWVPYSAFTGLQVQSQNII